MTTIAGLVADDKVWLGSDHVSMYGDQVRYRGAPKIFKKGDVLIGTSGAALVGEALQEYAPEFKRNLADSGRFIRSRVVPELRGVLREQKVIPNSEEREEFTGEMLVGVGDCLVRIGCDFSTHPAPFDAIGSGENYALAVLWTLVDLEDDPLMLKVKPQERLLMALRAAAEYDPYTRAPFTFLVGG